MIECDLNDWMLLNSEVGDCALATLIAFWQRCF